MRVPVSHALVMTRVQQMQSPGSLWVTFPSLRGSASPGLRPHVQLAQFGGPLSSPNSTVIIEFPVWRFVCRLRWGGRSILHLSFFHPGFGRIDFFVPWFPVASLPVSITVVAYSSARWAETLLVHGKLDSPSYSIAGFILPRELRCPLPNSPSAVTGHCAASTFPFLSTAAPLSVITVFDVLVRSASPFFPLCSGSIQVLIRSILGGAKVAALAFAG